jgi:alpha-D-ribose 1-methylphosphonate 5-triphosphate synthase subunit PhnG
MSLTVPDTRESSILDTLPDAEALLARRAAIVKELAPLRALYGGNGYMGERQFKLDEARIATVVRARLAEAGGKVTEGMIDEGTRTHAHYIAALEADVQQRAKWIELEESLASIDWRLRLRTSDSYLLSAELKLQ